jgi:hypothetical protein
MGQNKLRKSFKVCATCALWGGMRTAEFGGYAKFEQNQKGKCCGGGYNNAQMTPMAKCNKWELWPPIRK